MRIRQPKRRRGAVRAFPLVLLLWALTAAGCDKAAQDGGEGGAQQAGSAVGAEFQPARPIPNMHPWLSWAGLRLGMTSFELSQVYNAPEGRGDGFIRVSQNFGAAVNQFITFERPRNEEGEEDVTAPLFKLICAFYRDELFRLIDRREAINAAEAAEFFNECAEKFGDGYVETLGGAQWTWRDEDEDITVTFTQDNASELMMTAQLEITHMPTWRAWQAYNRDWAAKHPGTSEE
jgi:hypothetical protein